MDYEVYQYTDEEKSHYFLSEVTGDKRRAYALAKKPDKYFVFQGNYRLPSDNIKKGNDNETNRRNNNESIHEAVQ